MSSTTSIDVPGSAWAEALAAVLGRPAAGFLFDREQRFSALLDLVEVAGGPTPTVVDLACGTASITRRLLARLPGARAVAVDVDPVLLTIARGSLGDDERVRIVRADLRDPAWADALGGVEVDAVVTSTALHWLPEADLARLYRDLHGVVRPGGLVANADTMPADGLPRLNAGLTALAERRAVAALAGGIEAWDAWWERAATDPVLAGPMAERAGLFGGVRPPALVQPSGRVAPGRTRRRGLLRGRRGLVLGHRRGRRRPPLTGRARSLSTPPGLVPPAGSGSRRALAPDSRVPGSPRGPRQWVPIQGPRQWVPWTRPLEPRARLPRHPPGRGEPRGQSAGGATVSASRPAAGGDAPARPTR